MFIACLFLFLGSTLYATVGIVWSPYGFKETLIRFKRNPLRTVYIKMHKGRFARCVVYFIHNLVPTSFFAIFTFFYAYNLSKRNRTDREQLRIALEQLFTLSLANQLLLWRMEDWTQSMIDCTMYMLSRLYWMYLIRYLFPKGMYTKESNKFFHDAAMILAPYHLLYLAWNVHSPLQNTIRLECFMQAMLFPFCIAEFFGSQITDWEIYLKRKAYKDMNERIKGMIIQKFNPDIEALVRRYVKGGYAYSTTIPDNKPRWLNALDGLRSASHNAWATNRLFTGALGLRSRYFAVISCILVVSTANILVPDIPFTMSALTILVELLAALIWRLVRGDFKIR